MARTVERSSLVLRVSKHRAQRPIGSLLLRPPIRLFGGCGVGGEWIDLLPLGGWLLLGEEGDQLGDVVLRTRRILGLEEDVEVVLAEVGWELPACEGGGGAELLLRLALGDGRRLDVAQSDHDR